MEVKNTNPGIIIPEITNNEEYGAALTEFSKLMPNNPSYEQYAGKLSQYRDSLMVEKGEDPAETMDTRSREDRINLAANLGRDWKKYPDARGFVLRQKGEAYVNQFEGMKESERESLRFNEAVSSMAGEGEFAALNYCEKYGVKDLSSEGIMNHFRENVISKLDSESDAMKKGKEMAFEAMINELSGSGGNSPIGSGISFDGLTREGVYANAVFSEMHPVYESSLNALNIMQKWYDNNDVMPDEKKGAGSLHDWLRYGETARYEAEQFLYKLKRDNERAYALVMAVLEKQAKDGQSKNIPFFGALGTKPIRGIKSSVLQGRKLIGVDDIDDNSLSRDQQKSLAEKDRLFNDAATGLDGRAKKIISDNLKFRWDGRNALAQNSPKEKLLNDMSGILNESELRVLSLGLNAMDSRIQAHDDFYQGQAGVAGDLDSLGDTTNSLPDGSPTWMKWADLIGGAGGDTFSFISSAGLNTFSESVGRKFNEYRVDHSANEAFWRSVPYGAAEVASESLAYGKAGKAITWGVKKVPFAGKAVGKVEEYVKNGGVLTKGEMWLGKRAAARFGYETAVGGTMEVGEEFIPDTLAMPIDNAIAALYGSADAPSIENWRESMRNVCSADTFVSMYGFAALMGGLHIKGMRQDARILSMDKDALMAHGLSPEASERISQTVGTRNRISATRMELALLDIKNEKVRRNMVEGLKNLGHVEVTPEGAIVEAMMNLGEVDRFRRNDDGSFSVTKRETGESVVMDESAASSLLTSQINVNSLRRSIEENDLISRNAMVNDMKAEGVIFESMKTTGETVDVIGNLAARADILMRDGADFDSTDSSISDYIPLGAWRGIFEGMAERERIAKEQGDLSDEEKGISYSYRVRLRDGRTVVRFAEGKMSFLDILEEKIETHFSDSLEGGRPLDWYSENLRMSQQWLLENGYLDKPLVSADGDLSRLEITEAMSRLARGVALNEGALKKMPESVQFFIKLLRSLVDKALDLAKLGKAFSVGVENGHINKDFARDVYEFAGVGAEYWGDVAQKAERKALSKADGVDSHGFNNESSYSISGENINSLYDMSNGNDIEISNEKHGMFQFKWGSVGKISVNEKTKKEKIKGAFGLLHVIHRRLMNGYSLDESAKISVLGVSAAEDGQESIQGNKHKFDLGNVRSVVAFDDDGKKPVLTSFVLFGENEGAGAVDNHAAHVSHDFYALDSIDRQKQVGAALKRAIEWYEDVVKNNPLTYQNVFDSYGEELVDKFRIRDEGFSASFSSNAYELNLDRLKNGRSVAKAKFWKHFDKELKQIVRDAEMIESGAKDGGEFIARLHANLGVVRAATLYLPNKVKVDIRPYLSRLEMLAEMAATGKIDALRHLSESVRREINSEAEEALDAEIEKLRDDARLDIELARAESLADKKGELDERIEEKYRALDYHDRVSAKKFYNNRNKNIISIRKGNRSAEYISKRVQKENDKLDSALVKLQTRQQKLEDNIEKLEKRKEGLRSKKISPKEIKEMASGRIEEVRKAWADNKANSLMIDLVKEIDGKLSSFLKMEVISAINKMVDRVESKIKKNRNQERGKIGADHLKWIQTVVKPYMAMNEDAIAAEDASLEAKIIRIDDDALGGKISKEREAELEKEAGELHQRVLALRTFGGLKEMSLDEVVFAQESLARFINAGKARWSAVMESERARRDEMKNELNKILPKEATKSRLINARAEGAKKLGRKGSLFSRFISLIESPLQFFSDLSGNKGMEIFAISQQAKLSRMSAEAANRATERRDKLKAMMSKVSEETKTVKINKWLLDWRKLVPGAVSYSSTESDEFTIPYDKAEEVVAFPEEAAKWGYNVHHIKAITKAWEERQTEEPRRKRKDGTGLISKRNLKCVAVDIPSRGKVTLSKDIALKVLMICEQEDYMDLAGSNGWDEQSLRELHEFVGKEGMIIREWLLEEYKAQGDYLAEEYERVMGVPFIRRDGYSPADFIAFDKMNSKDVEQLLAGGSARTGANAGFLKVRQKHGRDINTEKGALMVYQQHMALTDNWVITNGWVRDMKSVLGDYHTANKLVANIGVTDFALFKTIVDAVEQGGIRGACSLGGSDKLIRELMNTKAVGVLGFKPWTWMKQYSAVMNTLYGDPDVDAGSFMKSLAKCSFNQGKMSWSEMKEQDFIKRRFMDSSEILERASTRPVGDDIYGGDIRARESMIPMGAFDVGANIVGACALYDTVYSELTGQGISYTEANDEALRRVELSLSIGAQPMGWMEKSIFQTSSNGVGLLNFMFMSEAINKLGLSIMYFRQGRWQKGLQVYFMSGIMNQLMGMFIDYLRDDEDRSGSDDWTAYALGVLLGPVTGIPIVCEMDSLANKALSACGIKQRFNSSGLGRAIFDTGAMFRAVKAAKDEKGKYTTLDTAKAVTKGTANASLITSMALACGGANSKIKAGALALSVIGNAFGWTLDVADFAGIQDAQEDSREGKNENKD